MTILGWIVKGKSAARAYFNRELEGIALHGSVIDVGGTNRPKPSYVNVLRIDGDVRSVNVDAEAQPDILADASRIPVADASFDHALCFNLLEHVEHPDAVLREIVRVLRPGGTLLLQTPFLVNVHGHPMDFRRYTDTALTNMATQAGFLVERVRVIGGGPFLAGVAQVQSVMPRLLFLPLFGIALLADAAVKTARPSYMTRWPLGYLLTCRKPAS